ncbi:hypothetical protein [Caldimonas brevitalea]|uniref:Uncharacterized protein n=1 Tax=Caldimonas brevitalea TaxID=413882 RepID=A0A0G3BRK0_9BURK|nr:hypothetical protein [Caldimonas brevitalea]AKJ30608.1 hypothetical protein AAW51_3917 [Caldimonas brevitalea]
MDSAAFNLETGKRLIEQARDTLVARGATLKSNRTLWMTLALGLIAGGSIAAYRMRQRRLQSQQGTLATHNQQRQDRWKDESDMQGLGSDPSTSLARSVDPVGDSRPSSDSLRSVSGNGAQI